MLMFSQNTVRKNYQKVITKAGFCENKKDGAIKSKSSYIFGRLKHYLARTRV